MFVRLYVPARDRRHRIACMALYRALLRVGARIPLPPNAGSTTAATNSVTPASARRVDGVGEAVSNVEVTPWYVSIRDVVREQFRKNRGDTSRRLVHASLTAGYKFLELFRNAQDPQTKAFAEVVAMLQTRNRYRQQKLPQEEAAARLAAQRAARAARPFVPILRKVVDPRDMSRVAYVPNREPKPREALTGKRGIPRLCATSKGVPFLRFTKPQPERLSQRLFQQNRQHQKWTEVLERLERLDLDDARYEDRWEAIVANLSPANGSSSSVAHGKAKQQDEPTYAQGVRIGIYHMRNILEADRQDKIARAKAMLQIVEEERKLAAAEGQTLPYF